MREQSGKGCFDIISAKLGLCGKQPEPLIPALNPLPQLAEAADLGKPEARSVSNMWDSVSKTKTCFIIANLNFRFKFTSCISFELTALPA